LIRLDKQENLSRKHENKRSTKQKN